MSQPRPLPPARLLRGPVDDESQIVVDQYIFNDFEHSQRSRYAPNWMTGPFYIFSPTRYFLNNLKPPPRVDTLLLPYANKTKNRSNSAQGGQSRVQSHHTSVNHKENSIVEQRGEWDQGEGKKKQGKPQYNNYFYF